MELKTEIITSKITIDSDGNGLSIPVRKYFEVDGNKFYQGETMRKSFRKNILKTVIENGVEVIVGEEINPNFNADIDAWTGEANFIKNRFNF